MPNYLITDNETGRKFKVSGDSPPSEAEAAQIFADMTRSKPATVAGNPAPQMIPSHTPGQVKAKPGVKSQIEDYLIGPTAPAAGVVDFATRVVPESARKLVPRIAHAAYTAVKGQTDPLVKSLSTLQPTGLPGREMEANAGSTLMNLAQAVTAPTGLMGLDAAKHAWSTDPVGSSLAAIPAAKLAKMAPKAINAIPESFEMSMYQRGLKGQGPFNGLKTVELNRRLNTALNEGIPLTEKGVAKLKGKVSEINTEVQQRIAEYADQGATVEMDKVLAPVADVRAKAANEAFPNKANTQIRNTVNEFENNTAIKQPGFDAVTSGPKVEIPIMQAQKFKESINRELNDFYEAMNKSPDKASYLARQWVAKTKAKIGDGLRAEISEIFPEVKELNQREGALIQLNKSLERAVNRIGQRDVISLKFLNALATSPKMALTEFIFNNPTIQSNLAIAIRWARNKANGAKPSSSSSGGTPYTPRERINQADRSEPRIPLNLSVGPETYFDPTIGARTTRR